MKFLPLVWSMLWRSRPRTWLTIASIVVAFFLFGVLQTILAIFEGGVRVSLADNVMVDARSPAAPLPIAYRDRIATIGGVKSVTGLLGLDMWVGDRQNYISTTANSLIGSDFDPRFVIPAQQLQALLRTRTGVIAGKQLADKYGWKLGDHITLQSAMPKQDGSPAWEFDVVGFFTFNHDLVGDLPADSLFVNYDYINESMMSEIDRNTVLRYYARVDSFSIADSVSRAIDAKFANSPAETRSEPESQAMLRDIEQLGDIGLIVHAVLAAVFFALALVAGNTMMQAFRERTAELGVLKTLGFSDAQLAALVVFEALLLAIGAALVGLITAYVGIPIASRSSFLKLPEIRLATSDLVAGIGFALAIGMAAAAIPAWLSRRLTVVEALARQ